MWLSCEPHVTQASTLAFNANDDMYYFCEILTSGLHRVVLSGRHNTCTCFAYQYFCIVERKWGIHDLFWAKNTQQHGKALLQLWFRFVWSVYEKKHLHIEMKCKMCSICCIAVNGHFRLKTTNQIKQKSKTTDFCGKTIHQNS